MRGSRFRLGDIISLIVRLILIFGLVIAIIMIVKNVTSKEASPSENTGEPNHVVSAGNGIEESNQQEILNVVTIPDDAMRFDGHSYSVFNYDDIVASSWEEAQVYCESLGGYLAIINSEEENSAIFSYINEVALGYAFFGLSDAVNEGDWRWVDGSRNSGYLNWGFDIDGNPEPNSDSKSEDYAEFTADRQDGSWNDSKFGYDTSVFVCEWDS